MVYAASLTTNNQILKGECLLKLALIMTLIFLWNKLHGNQEMQLPMTWYVIKLLELCFNLSKLAVTAFKIILNAID